MIDARQLRRSCVVRVATLSLYTRVACDYYSNFHDSQRPAGFQQAVPIAHRDCSYSEYLLSAPLFVNRCLALPAVHRET